MKIEIIEWPKHYYTYKEVSELYGMSQHYVKKFAEDSHAIVRLGVRRLNLIDRRILDAYLETNQPVLRGQFKKDQEQRKESV